MKTRLMHWYRCLTLIVFAAGTLLPPYVGGHAQLALALGPSAVKGANAPALPWHFDELGQLLVVQVGEIRVREVRVFDTLGRGLMAPSYRRGHTLALSTRSLPPGSHLVRIATDRGLSVIRFVKQ